MSGNLELNCCPVCGRNGLLVKGGLDEPYPAYIGVLVVVRKQGCEICYCADLIYFKAMEHVRNYLCEINLC